MKSPKQWVKENSQSGPFDLVNSSSEAAELVAAIQADAIEPAAYTEFTYTLMQNGDRFQWRRLDGVPVSPEFGTVEAAYHFQANNPILTDEEWRERFPLPKQADISTIQSA